MDNDGDMSDDELYDNALAEAYKILYLKWTNESKVVEKQNERMETLIQEKIHIMITI